MQACYYYTIHVQKTTFDSHDPPIPPNFHRRKLDKCRLRKEYSHRQCTFSQNHQYKYRTATKRYAASIPPSKEANKNFRKYLHHEIMKKEV